VTTSRIFLVVGAPAVGKSTTSRALAARFERSIHIPVDDLRDMVVSGLVQPNPTWSEQLVEQVGLARRTAIASAVSYADAGFAVVIDDFWDPPGLIEYDDVPADRPFNRVLLRPDREEALRRNFGRHGDDPVRAYLDDGVHHVYDLLETPAARARLEQGRWLVLDTTRLAVDVAVDRILEHGGVTTRAAPR
jgi:tRNA uridine 5-carbamoylmethylation protein Kti12